MKPPPDMGQCSDHNCDKPATGVLVCKFCAKTYAFCSDHRTEINIPMNGHVLRVHPESLPKDAIERVMQNESAMAELHEQAALYPEMWKHLFDHMVLVAEGREAAPPTFDAKAFLTEARRRGPSGPVFRHFNGWELQLSFGPIYGRDNVFYLSAMLYPSMRGSTNEDWRQLGEMCAALGAPHDPVLDWAEFHPNAPHHFCWDADSGERIELPEPDKNVLREMQKKRMSGEKAS